MNTCWRSGGGSGKPQFGPVVGCHCGRCNPWCIWGRRLPGVGRLWQWICETGLPFPQGQVTVHSWTRDAQLRRKPLAEPGSLSSAAGATLAAPLGGFNHALQSPHPLLFASKSQKTLASASHDKPLMRRVTVLPSLPGSSLLVSVPYSNYEVWRPPIYLSPNNSLTHMWSGC